MYTVIVGVVTEGIARSVGHALFVEVPQSLEVSGYSPFHQRIRPIELALLAVVCWWCFNKTLRREVEVLARHRDVMDRSRLAGDSDGHQGTDRCADVHGVLGGDNRLSSLY